MGVEGDWSSSRVKGSALVGGGAKPHKRRERRERDEPRPKTEMGEFARGNSLYSPIPVANLSAFRSFGFASLVGRCPTPRWWRCPQVPAREPVPWTPRSHSLASYALRYAFFFFVIPLNSHLSLHHLQKTAVSIKGNSRFFILNHVASIHQPLVSDVSPAVLTDETASAVFTGCGAAVVDLVVVGAGACVVVE